MRFARRSFLSVALAGGASALVSPRCASAARGVFDDGSSSIPPPVDGPIERVLVLRAGMAGLGAAQALHNAGIDVVVLEAKNRLGGRTFTADVGGVPVDLGASWIHTPDGNPMHTVATLAGVAITPADPTNLEKLSGWEAESGWLTSAEIGLPLLYTETFASALPQLRDDLGPDASLADALYRSSRA